MLAAGAAISPVFVAGRTIGPGAPCFVIAEAGVNHNGDIAIAHRLIDAARAAGADAVKFQTFSADALAIETAPKATYQIESTGQGSQREMLRVLELTPDDHRSLLAHCDQAGILFMSSPFDETSADLLDALSVAAFKIPSGEITNTPFLAHVARKRRTVILSTGMSTLDEVRRAVEVLSENYAPGIVLLHCVSAYPANSADMNLRAMATLEETFRRPVGLSDHTLGIAMPIAAAALSACVIEKHITLDCSMVGPDHRASLNPIQFKEMVAAVRAVECALGDGRKEPRPVEQDTARIARKSLHARCDLTKGAVLGPDSIVIARPATGLPPYALPQVIGRSLRRPLAKGEPINLDDLV